MLNPFNSSNVRFARFGATTPFSVGAALSDAAYNAAVQQGKWIVLQNGGVSDPRDGSLVRNNDGTWSFKNGGANVGYVVGLHPPIHHGVAGAVDSVEQDVVSAVNWVGGAVGSIEGALASAFSAVESVASTLGGDVVSVVSSIVSSFPNDVDALVGLAKFLLQIAKDVIALVDPTGTSASRQAALNRLNPFHTSSTVYQFITSPSYDASFRMLFWLVILGPLIVCVWPLLLAQANPLTQNSIEAIIQAVRDIVTGIAVGQNVFAVVEAVVTDVISAILGVPIGPATALKVTYLVLAGLPIPPLVAILDAILADPIAQQFVGKTLHLSSTMVDQWMPIVMNCLNVADGGSWLNCLQAVIDAIFPRLIATLHKYSIDLNDLRVVVQSAWETGGDINLMLKHNIIANKVQFGAANLSNLSPVQTAFISIGFFGIGFLASKIGIQNADDFFINTFAPLLPKDVQADVQASYDVFRFAEQMIIEAGRADEKLKPSQAGASIPSDVLYLVETFHDNKWDVESTITALISDELDPSGSSHRFFSSLLPFDSKSGKFVVTTTLMALITKLATDFPKLTYQIKALLAHLEIDPAEATTNSKTVAAVAQQVSNQIPSSSKPITQVNAGTFATAAAVAAANKKAGLNLEAVGAGALTGAFIGGPAGALIGAAAGLIAKK